MSRFVTLLLRVEVWWRTETWVELIAVRRQVFTPDFFQFNFEAIAPKLPGHRPKPRHRLRTWVCADVSGDTVASDRTEEPTTKARGHIPDRTSRCRQESMVDGSGGSRSKIATPCAPEYERTALRISASVIFQVPHFGRFAIARMRSMSDWNTCICVFIEPHWTRPGMKKV